MFDWIVFLILFICAMLMIRTNKSIRSLIHKRIEKDKEIKVDIEVAKERKKLVKKELAEAKKILRKT